jgi:hypothetical protein
MTLHNTPAPMPKKMRKKRDTTPPTTTYSFGTLVCSFYRTHNTSEEVREMRIRGNMRTLCRSPEMTAVKEITD